MLPSTPEKTGYKYQEKKKSLRTALNLYSTAVMLWLTSCLPFPQAETAEKPTSTAPPQQSFLVGPRADSGSEFSKYGTVLVKKKATPESKRGRVDKHMCVGEWDKKNTFSTSKWIDGKLYLLVVKKHINNEIITTVNGMNPEEALPEGWLIINPEEDCYQLIQLTR